MATGNLLDVRDRSSFEAGHLRGAVSLPVPTPADDHALLADALPGVLLPPRHEPLLVYGDVPAHVTRVVSFLRDRGRERVHGAVLTGDDAPTGWWLAGGDVGTLWRPPAFLAEHVSMLPPCNAGPVLDLGCGSGRAAVWLAQRNYDVTAVDHLEDALALAGKLADLHGSELTLLCRDLENPSQVPVGPWAVAMSFRFLVRDLLLRLPELLMPGGVAMMRTFRWVKGDKRLPRRRYCLEAGELLDLFPDDRYDILRHVEDHDDDGRPAAGIVARLR